MTAERLRTLLPVVLLVVAAGCRESSGPVAPPGSEGEIDALYRHVETTGLADELTLSDGTRIRIEFSPSSASRELAALHHLTSHCNDSRTSWIFGTTPPEFSGYAGEAYRQLIRVRGKLDGTVRTHPTFLDTYRSFELHGWSLETPVEVAFATRPDSVSEGLVKRVVHNAQEAGCPPLHHDGGVVDMQSFFRAAPE